MLKLTVGTEFSAVRPLIGVICRVCERTVSIRLFEYVILHTHLPVPLPDSLESGFFRARIWLRSRSSWTNWKTPEFSAIWISNEPTLVILISSFLLGQDLYSGPHSSYLLPTFLPGLSSSRWENRIELNTDFLFIKASKYGYRLLLYGRIQDV